MDTAIVVISTLVSLGAAFYMFAMSNIANLKADWPIHRCDPSYMPFASMVGQDPVKNFTDCTMKSFHDYAGFVVDPIMTQFSTMTDVVSEIGGSMDSMRGMIGDTRNGFLGIVGMVFGKIQNLMSQFQYIIIRMRTLLARVVGIMMSFMYVFYGAMDTGSSVLKGPIGQTMNFLCFDENTLVDISGGGKISMKNIKFGETLRGGNKVTSIYNITGYDVPMFKLGSVLVSGAHKVKHENKFIPVSQHPDAVPYNTGSLKLVCLNTSTNRIYIDNYEFMDFVESTDKTTIKNKRDFTELVYSGKLDASNDLSAFGIMYPVGLFGNVNVSLSSGKKPIMTVVPGDILDNGDIVVGIVAHLVGQTYYGQIDKGILAHVGVWVVEGSGIKSVVSYGRVSHDKVPMVLYHLITKEGTFPVISDTGNRYIIVDELGARPSD